MKRKCIILITDTITGAHALQQVLGDIFILTEVASIVEALDVFHSKRIDLKVSGPI